MPQNEPPAPAGASAPSPAEVADEFSRTAKMLGGRLAEQLTAHGLSMPRFSLLVALDRHGPSRITRLGERVGISQGTASTLVESLVRDGLVERHTDADDARAARLAITSAGRDKARAWRADYERAAERAFAPISPRQRSTLVELLRELSQTTN